MKKVDLDEISNEQKISRNCCLLFSHNLLPTLSKNLHY